MTLTRPGLRATKSGLWPYISRKVDSKDFHLALCAGSTAKALEEGVYTSSIEPYCGTSSDIVSSKNILAHVQLLCGSQYPCLARRTDERLPHQILDKPQTADSHGS